ncbi:hypothetical protein PGT21_034175 [Puccinia graminis f. sp. tritici]|uniref:Uncharacterized protein n=1 Tax=Puccinia graminis f. sp. tritici TaxID=56615 RepID=A0A5B0PMS6_PUCGR|nr:hypothetical protein PGT21_034175 [Puccinia graminis f. sp. tritici]
MGLWRLGGRKIGLWEPTLWGLGLGKVLFGMGTVDQEELRGALTARKKLSRVALHPYTLCQGISLRHKRCMDQSVVWQRRAPSHVMFCSGHQRHTPSVFKRHKNHVYRTLKARIRRDLWQQPAGGGTYNMGYKMQLVSEFNPHSPSTNSHCVFLFLHKTL